MYKLFEVFGVEMEYMVVDSSTLKVKSIVDEVIKEESGSYTADVEKDDMAWSNELISHVIEFKTNGPTSSLENLPEKFLMQIKTVNQILAKHNAILLPSGCHPFVDPFTETKIWEHEYNEVYSLYNKIFDCRGHGWSNLQSTHLNLPFANDAEFEKLHAAIRLLLPIIPAISASSPILDGRITGFSDSRLEVYRKNQAKIPSIAGSIIPEAVFSKQEYYDKIFNKIIEDIKPYDTDNILDHHFLNSRGAISRFDRGAIEIRIIDIQECPLADISILHAIIEVLKALVDEKWISLTEQKKWDEKALLDILLSCIKFGENAKITNKEYLGIFGIEKEEAFAKDIWKHLRSELNDKFQNRFGKVFDEILLHGTLSTRIMKGLNTNYSIENMKKVYGNLSDCLHKNELYIP